LQGIWSLHPEAGITHPSYEESLVKRAMIENSGRVVALATKEKLGTAMPFVVAPARVVTDLVTEPGVPPEVIGPFESIGINVVFART
jgi:DeoR/GlpR family transcriptional regulator of sugar metabolism